MPLSQMELDRGCNCGNLWKLKWRFCLWGPTSFECKRSHSLWCHFQQLLDIFPEAGPLSFRYAEQIIPPLPLEGSGFLSRDSRIIHTPMPPEAWGEEREKMKQRESGSCEPWKVKQACVMFLERNTENGQRRWLLIHALILGSAQVRCREEYREGLNYSVHWQLLYAFLKDEA